MARTLEPYQLVERSIITKYRKVLWNPFIEAVKRYEMIQPGDRIAVCISGGKDSMLLAKLMQQLQKHSDFPFELVFLVMDPGYNELNRQKIESNAALLNIPVTIFESDIFEVADSAGKSPLSLLPRSAGAICTAARRSSAATRSLSGTISTMWSRRRSSACSTALSFRPCCRSCTAQTSRA